LSAGSFDFLILIGLTLVVTNMIVVRTATTNYVMMYIPLFLGLKVAAERLPGGHGWVAAFYLVSTVSSWLLFLNTLSGDLEHPIVYLPLPITLLVMLIWELSARSRKGSRRSKQRRQAM
jgi:hypothetical protein